ncbi:catalase-like domain-containing protein [Delphinella strobiligena]|nr:catalase-like domain-containing protein [Delphinella strobiligena]
MKVFDVHGPRLEGVEDSANTQDFFFNNAPSIELTDVDTTLEIMSLREKYFDDPTTLGLKLKLRTDALKQHAPYMLPNTNIISHSLYTQSAFRFGKYYGHMGMFPVREEQKQSAEPVQKSDPEGILSDRLFDYFQGKEAKYEIKIQLGTDPAHHPTEDASVVWDETTAPYQILGTVTFPPQDSFNQARRVAWEDRLLLDPWRGLADHRPLGSVNRLRKGVYPHSRKQRDAMNASESKDAHSIDDIP